MFKKWHKSLLIVLLLTIIGGFLHFYNLTWGAPFYFHPDERNIASAVSQIQFSKHMNPQFFAYGSLPIYTIYFTGYATNVIHSFLNSGPHSVNPTFTQAILISRIFSAIFATLLIPLLFSLGKKLNNTNTGLLAAFFATFCVGFIQFAHFGTFEMWLTFFGTLLFWSCLTVMEEKKLEHIVLLALIFGILIAVKVSSLALIPLPLVVLLPLKKTKTWLNPKQIFVTLGRIVFFTLIASLVFILTNPYVFLDRQDFLSSMHYESGVALGSEPVFYTGNFFTTVPGIYQLLHVYPFLINPLMTVIFIPSLIYLFFVIFKQRPKPFVLLAAFFVILFISQAFLFVKWTRYMMPTVPFIALTVALALNALSQANKHLSRLLTIEITILLILNSIVALSYFKTAFIDIDSRLAAVIRAQEAIPPDAHILIEPADLGALPFQEAFTHVDSFNFYDLDTNSASSTEMMLQQKIANSQYIILPSQRIVQSRLLDPSKFPKGYVFYKTLFNGNLGFKKIYETPCDIYCTITYLGDPVFWWEQTASVFDRPTVFIFKKE